jgi:hypothetical protein
MTLPTDLEELVERYRRDWRNAEAVVKEAELISGNVVLSSINELRYAGRRFNDYNIAVSKNAPAEELKVHLLEAWENCRKARHDAVDATIFHVDSEVNQFTKNAGLDVLVEHFPGYYDLTDLLDQAGALITRSRKDRENLDKHYEELETTCYPGILNHWKKLRRCRDVITQYRKRRRRDFWVGVVVVGIIVGLVSGAAITALDKRHAFDFFGEPAEKVSTPAASAANPPRCTPCVIKDPVASRPHDK